MACSSITLTGINVGCRDNIGSIKEVFAIKKDEVVAIELDADNEKIETLTLAEGKKFARYRFRKATSNMVTTMNVDDAVGSMSFQTDVSLKFNKMETKKRLELMSLALDELIVIVKDGMDQMWLLGFDFPVTVTALNANSGTAFSDFNGYEVTLQDVSRELPYEIPSTVFDEANMVADFVA